MIKHAPCPSFIFIMRYHFNPRSLAGATAAAPAKTFYRRFQSTLPCGSDALFRITIIVLSISIHAPLRERLGAQHATGWVIIISIHAPLRERLCISPRTRPSMLFQSTLPCGSDKLVLSNSIASGRKFQSTLPCGSDLRCGTCPKRAKISIHAPSRERLTPAYRTSPQRGISIHAPSRERQELIYEQKFNPYFNPRSLTGATRIQKDFQPLHQFQSTLPHRSDSKRCLSPQVIRYFNPCSLTGATMATDSLNALTRFQSTLPHGSD